MPYSESHAESLCKYSEIAYLGYLKAHFDVDIGETLVNLGRERSAWCGSCQSVYSSGYAGMVAGVGPQAGAGGSAVGLDCVSAGFAGGVGSGAVSGDEYVGRTSVGGFRVDSTDHVVGGVPGGAAVGGTVGGSGEPVRDDALVEKQKKKELKKAKKRRRKLRRRGVQSPEVPEWRRSASPLTGSPSVSSVTAVEKQLPAVRCVNCGKSGCACSVLQVSFASRRVAENEAAALKAKRVLARLRDTELQSEYDEMTKLQVLTRAKASALKHEQWALQLESLSPSSSASMAEVKKVLGEVESLHTMLLSVAELAPEVHAKVLKERLKEEAERDTAADDYDDVFYGESKEDEAYERGGHLPIMAKLRAMAKERAEVSWAYCEDKEDDEYKRLLGQMKTMHV